MKVLFDETRAVRVFRVLQELWKQQRGIYRKEYLPENLYPDPKENRRELANYLFYAVLTMRGAVDSDDPLKLISRLYSAYPEMFNPQAVKAKWHTGRIEHAIKSVMRTDPCWQQKLFETEREPRASRSLRGDIKIGAGSLSYNLDDLISCWYKNSVFIANRWGGNILNVFKGVQDFEGAFTRVDPRQDTRKTHLGTRVLYPGLFGMRRKIFALLTIWLQTKGKRGIIPRFPTPIPVDFHTLRVLWATEIISFEGLQPFAPRTERQRQIPSLVGKMLVSSSESIVDQVMQWSQKFMVREGFDHTAINPAVWVLSRERCARHPQNQMSGKGTVFLEPETLRADDTWPQNYRDPCRPCPLKEECTGVVPAAIHYDLGFLVRMERVLYPHHHPVLPLSVKRGRFSKTLGLG